MVKIESPANIAFTKYWGRANHELFIPANDSISMNLDSCTTVTEAELHNGKEDEIVLKFENEEPKKLEPESRKAKAIFAQIERIRDLSDEKKKIKIYSENNFPADAGIASSASGLSALTAACLLEYGMEDKFNDKAEFTRQIRLCGSGSAARSGIDGFVKLIAGGTHDASFCEQVADVDHWDLVDIVAVVDASKKKHSSSKGHEVAETSILFKHRLSGMPERNQLVTKSILEKNIELLGTTIEAEVLSMHAVMMSSNPTMYYWEPGTYSLMKALVELREETGTQAYFTIDAGPNLHIICEKQNQPIIEKFLKNRNEVSRIITNGNTKGTSVIES